MKIKPTISNFLLCLALFCLNLCFSSSATAASEVRFDWFEYSGKDSTLDRELKPGEYHNPILSGFYPDPSICKAGDDYYLVNSTFAYFPGLPIFHSKDLVNWKQIGNAIDRTDQLKYEGLHVSGGIFAPAISHHKGTFYLICTMVGSNGNFVITATDPAGPWSDPKRLDFPGIDPSIFFDDDNRAWIVSNDSPEGRPLYSGHRAIRLQELDLATMQVKGPRPVLINGGIDISTKPIWIEGPHLFKKDAWYYLTCAEGGTGPNHSQVILRSKTVEGPYIPWDKNPILTQRGLDPRVAGAVTCTGHSDLVIGPDGNWWATFLGVRPYDGHSSPMGRETFLLPVSWNDEGWPTILPAGDRVPLFCEAPLGIQVTQQKSNEFSWRDNFASDQLSTEWIMLRAPLETWWKNNKEEGVISLTPQTKLLSGNSNPSYLGYRVQHPEFSVSLKAEIPTARNVTSGLALFQNENHYYFLSVRKQQEGILLQLEKAKGGEAKVIAEKFLPSISEITLRAQANEATCSFGYRLKEGDWETLISKQDAKLLTTAVAGGFVGATAGPYTSYVKTDKLGYNDPSYLDTDLYTADPSAHVFDGKIYLYPSHDIESNIPENDHGAHFSMRDYHVFSMDSVGKKVTDHGRVLDVDEVPWASRQMWAPDCATKEGKYYLYFPAKDTDDIFRIGVAVSDKPEGPFKAEPKPIDGSYSIDPTAFKDDDGTHYLFFGGIWGGQMQNYRNNKPITPGRLPNDNEPAADEPALCPKVAKLSDSMKQFDENPRNLLILDKAGKPITAGDHNRRFFEAAWMHKYNGKYYFSYSTGDTHHICYAIGDSPYGPFTYQGEILTPVVGWTSHHSIVEQNGNWYLFYHDSVPSGGQTHLRSVKVSKLEYDADGHIKTINGKAQVESTNE